MCKLKCEAYFWQADEERNEFKLEILSYLVILKPWMNPLLPFVLNTVISVTLNACALIRQARPVE